MFKKTTSILLAVSFFILVISGVIMLFDKRLAFKFRMEPFHELFAIIVVVTGIIHFIINFKTFISYLKIKPINLIFYSTVGLAIVLWIIAMNTKLPEKGSNFRKHHVKTESGDQIHD
jgi:hypothetical protein